MQKDYKLNSKKRKSKKLFLDLKKLGETTK